MKNTLILIQGSTPDFGLLCKAQSLAKQGKLSFRVISVGALEKAVADDGLIARCLAPKMEDARVILAPATVRLRGIMPMLAWYLGAGLTADCTALEIAENGQLLQTRPAFGNSLMAVIKTLSLVQMATVRPGTFPPEEKILYDAEELTVPEEIPQVAEVAFEPFADGTPITQAQIIVAGGVGVGSKEGFAKLTAFAKRIGAGIGASRGAVDAHYAPYSAQVGITGTTVCPKLYIAVGIHGAVQHISGMSGSKTVIAINSDPKAPIFDYADYGIVGDWETIIDEIMEEM